MAYKGREVETHVLQRQPKTTDDWNELSQNGNQNRIKIAGNFSTPTKSCQERELPKFKGALPYKSNMQVTRYIYTATADALSLPTNNMLLPVLQKSHCPTLATPVFSSKWVWPPEASASLQHSENLWWSENLGVQ